MTGFEIVAKFSTEYLIDVKIGDNCNVAVRPVTRRSSGEEIDTGTFIDEPIQLTVVIRLSLAEKGTIQNIFDENIKMTVKLNSENGTWTFSNAWFANKNISFENAVDVDGTNRMWKTTLMFIAESATWVGV